MSSEWLDSVVSHESTVVTPDSADDELTLVIWSLNAVIHPSRIVAATLARAIALRLTHLSYKRRSRPAFHARTERSRGNVERYEASLLVSRTPSEVSVVLSYPTVTQPFM